MSIQVVFRCDADRHMGGGHAMRCATLADALASLGADCRFATRATTLDVLPALERFAITLITGNDDASAVAGGCDVLVVDHYGLDARFETACRPWTRHILAIDDLANRPHNCDLLLDQTFGREARDYAGLVPAQAILLAGSHHALLRPQFAAHRPAGLARRRDSLRRMLLAFGTTDAENVTATTLRGLLAMDLAAEVDVVLGSAAPHLADVRALLTQARFPARLHIQVTEMAALMTECDLALGAGGVSALERCTVGVPSLLVVLADNQRKVAEGMFTGGAAESLGWWEDLSPGFVASAVSQLVAEPHRLKTMSTAAAAICDGLGAERVARLVMDMAV